MGKLELHIPLAGLIDTSAETARLQKELSRLEQEITRFNGKLGNPEFVNKAPPAVIEKEQQKLKDAEQSKTQILMQIEKLKKL